MKRYTIPLFVVLTLISCQSMSSFGKDLSALGNIGIPEQTAAEEKREGLVLEVVPDLGKTETAQEESTVEEPVSEEEEITPIAADEAVEPILEPSEEDIAPYAQEIELLEPKLEEVMEQKATIEKLKEGTVPDAILWTFCVMFLATLFTLCYIAKQRKEATWHKFRD